MGGNCFTFGATCDMEAAWFLAGNDLVSLSEQQLTSCDRIGGDEGCDGGDTNLDTDEYVSKHGITSEQNYPYSKKAYNKGKSRWLRSPTATKSRAASRAATGATSSRSMRRSCGSISRPLGHSPSPSTLCSWTATRAASRAPTWSCAPS